MWRRCCAVVVGLGMAACLFAGCSQVKPILQGQSNEQTFVANTELVPDNVLQLGESFEWRPYGAEGHLTGTVTAVRVVKDAAECPPKEQFTENEFVVISGENETFYEYEQWFTEGGAYDQGCRLILVDISVTNVDAACPVDTGSFSDGGRFYDPYMFLGYNILIMADLTEYEKLGDNHISFKSHPASYFSYNGVCFDEDIPETKGIEPHAIRIAPGEIVSYTLGYFVNSVEQGKAKPLSKQWLCVGASSDKADGVFIDTKLEDGTE